MIDYMLNRKATKVLIVFGLIKKILLYIKMNYFPPYSYSKNKIEVKFSRYHNKATWRWNCKP